MKPTRVLAIVFSPANVISALGATIHKHGGRACLTLGVCDWPGMSNAENQKRLEIYRNMTATIPFVSEVISLTDTMANQAAQQVSARDFIAHVKQWVSHEIDEIQYSHDLHGSIYQMSCIAWQHARRVTFGDGFGHIATKEDYLSSQRADKSRAHGAVKKLQYRSLRLWNLIRIVFAERHLSSIPPAEHILFSPHEYRLFLPVSDYNLRPAHSKLTVLPKSLFLEVLNLIRVSTDAVRYERKLISDFRGRPAILLATENYVETGLLTLDQELSMWVDMLAPHLQGNPLVIVKQHPGERQPRWRLLAERLAGRAEVSDFAQNYQRLPLEVFTGLADKVNFVTSSYLRASLNYLHGLKISNPMTKTVIENYFPEWFWPHMTKAARDQDAYIEALANWDGKSMLYLGQNAGRNHSS